MALPWEVWTCGGCGRSNADCEAAGLPSVEERYSLGLYAGRWCDPCWARSGYRKEGPNPARWKGHLDHLLPKRSPVATINHHAALSIDETPGIKES